MKQFKNTLIGILVMLLVFTGLSVTAFADEFKPGTYTLTKDNYLDSGLVNVETEGFNGRFRIEAPDGMILTHIKYQRDSRFTDEGFEETAEKIVDGKIIVEEDLNDTSFLVPAIDEGERSDIEVTIAKADGYTPPEKTSDENAQRTLTTQGWVTGGIFWVVIAAAVIVVIVVVVMIIKKKKSRK